MSSLAEVARRAGVSKATASRALSGAAHVSPAAKERVAAAAADLGYVVSSTAASLVTGRTKNVGVITPFINRWFFAEVLEGIEGALIQAGYDLTLFRLPPEPEQRSRLFRYFLVRKRVDAIVCVGVELAPGEVELIQALRRPAVGIGGAIPGIMTMCIDDEQAARLATRHLISLGHTRIVHIGGDLDAQLDFKVHSRRLAGFRGAMDEAGLEHPDDFRPARTFSVPGGYEAAMSLLADPRSRPTAIVAGCDEIAIGAITAARQLGIVVPSGLSIVGIDDHPYSEMFGLTTVRQRPGEQGELAVDLVVRAMTEVDGGLPSTSIDIPITLVVRTSTTAPVPSLLR
ncbi:LacI family DNA-binding transcriptional regulator [Pseudolysinimonas sp.]|uniref:LacI family DNA-binding transcriptional regulator n=1 Tax=Pseudolysinimonas sp. TaxID=2680009 RepID=UPI00286B2F60|nr:LacI family DNA-binding transcriptional regulator [Pseudolysinimonas sp.]